MPKASDDLSSLNQAQMLSNINKRTKIPIETLRQAFKGWAEEAQDAFLQGKVVPLPGAIGYIYPSITTTKSREILLSATNSEVQIRPSLKTVASFSSPWKTAIKNDSRSKKLLEILLQKKLEALQRKKKTTVHKPEETLP